MESSITTKEGHYDIAYLKAVFKIPKDCEDVFHNMPIQEISEQIKSVCVIGAAGSGKSASCKTISGLKDEDIFKTTN
jgi:ABC-type dipeptide/oligopeptide/nickel transport system ATPase component